MFLGSSWAAVGFVPPAEWGIHPQACGMSCLCSIPALELSQGLPCLGLLTGAGRGAPAAAKAVAPPVSAFFEEFSVSHPQQGLHLSGETQEQALDNSALTPTQQSDSGANKFTNRRGNPRHLKNESQTPELL